ncbi:MAG: hypothetical protein ACQEVA_10265 [Myxococcota bacterium]
MFRTKITLTFVIIVAAVAATGYLVLDGRVTKALKTDAENSLRRAATIEEQSIRLDEVALMEKARFTARNGRLARYMSLDDEEKQELYEKLSAKYTQGSNTDEVRHLAVYNEPLTTDRIRLEDIAKRIGGQRNIDLSPLQRRPVIPDMFMILDRGGVGVAALGKDRYSWFGDNVAKQFPQVLQVVEDNRPATAVWDWSWGASDDSELYRVAIVPIRQTPEEEPAGVVVVGNIIDDEVANRSQRLMGGITAAPSESKELSDKLVPRMPQVAFFQGQKLRGSTFSSQEEGALAKQLFEDKKILESDNPEDMISVTVDGRPYRALVRFLSGEFDEADDPAGFVVLTNLGEALAPVEQAKETLLLATGGALAAGIILMIFFVFQFIRPAARIEEGITEIIAGNKDYQFEVDEGNAVFSSIAQGLNLMSAYLQGKPMPDEDDLGGWGELVGDVDTDGGGGGGNKQVQGVQMPGMRGGKKSSDDESSS